MAASIDALLEKADNIKKDDGKNDGKNKTRSAFAGMIVGGVVGVMIGYTKKWNLFYSLLGGAILGSGVTYIFTPES
jgi:F0F1-type ATP synthase assembly protein I